MKGQMMETNTQLNKYIVYMHICPNGKRYIGITQQSPERRWQYGGGYRNNCRFYKAIQKYGWDNVMHILLYCGLTKEMAEAKEIELIAKYKSNKRKYGYNIDNGGSTSGTHTKATCKRISNAKKGQMAGTKHWHYAQHWSEDVRKKMSESHKGKKCPEETIAKTGKKVRCVETGAFYNSIREACRLNNLDRKSVALCCKGIKYYNTAGGYHWQYAKEVE